MQNDNPSYAAEEVQAELDKQLFHLKTLYDVSHELLGLTDVSMILRNFLLMTMGNFGTAQGFIMDENAHTGEINHFESFGFEEEEHLPYPEPRQRSSLEENLWPFFDA